MCRLRSSSALPDHPSRRIRSRSGCWHLTTLRSAFGLRRASCRLPRRTGEPQASSSWSFSGRISRQCREASHSAGITNSRATYSTRKSYEQYLHRSGTFSCHCVNVRSLAWPRWAAGDCPRVHDLTSKLALGLQGVGFPVLNESFLTPLRVSAPGQASDIVARALKEGFNLHFVNTDVVGIALDETCDTALIEALLRLLRRRPRP